MYIECVFYLDWSRSELLNLFAVIAYFITAIIMYLTLDEGRKQTKISLSISQFNILDNLLSDFINEAKTITFKSELEDDSFLNNILKSHPELSGIYYMPLLIIALNNRLGVMLRDGEIDRLNNYRHNIVFPLVGYYDKLYGFIIDVIKDEVITEKYKKMLLKKVEREILQTYFRVCNYSVINDGVLAYNLNPLETENFDLDSFYKINKLYIDKGLFEYKDLDFYKETT